MNNYNIIRWCQAFYDITYFLTSITMPDP